MSCPHGYSAGLLEAEERYTGTPYPLDRMPQRILNATIAAALTLPSGILAQVTAPQPLSPGARGASGAGSAETKYQPPGKERRYRGAYRESVSRELFRACDSNSDDRLDVFETVDAFDFLPSPRDHQGYARFDSDRDGFVSWREFDHRFRRGLKVGGVFRVRTCRSYTMPEAPPQKPTPLQDFIQTFDKNGDGALSPEEIQKLLQATGMPPTLAAPMTRLDLDASGTVSEVELAPWFQSLPITGLAKSTGISPLPQPWFDGDRDKDGAIDLNELRGVLRSLDPDLLRWANALMRKADRNRDGQLSRLELQSTAPQQGPATKKKSPKRAPAR